MSDAIETQGTILRIGDDATPIVYKPIGEVKTWDGPNGQANVIDVSHLQSTRREKRMGLPDEGQVSLTCNYVSGDPGQMAMRTARAQRELHSYQIELTSGEILTFDGYCLNFGLSGGVDNVVELGVTIEITGEVVSTPAP